MTCSPTTTRLINLRVLLLASPFLWRLPLTQTLRKAVACLTDTVVLLRLPIVVKHVRQMNRMVLWVLPVGWAMLKLQFRYTPLKLPKV